MGRGGLDEYEAWLDELDGKLYRADHVIRVEFGDPFTIPLSSCADIAGLKSCALRLRIGLREEGSLPKKYLLGRFLKIAIDSNSLSVSWEQLMNELCQEWNIKDEFKDF